MKKRMFAILLAAMITASTVACGETEQAPETTADTTAAVTETTEEAETQIQLSLSILSNGPPYCQCGSVKFDTPFF